MLMVMPMMTDKPLLPPQLDDDISDAELEAITEGMLKDVLARKALAQRKLDNDLAKAMADANAYFRVQPAP